MPAWASYLEIVRAAGGVPVPVEPAAGCRVDLEACARKVSPQTKALLFCSPSNPSGVVWSEEETRGLAELAAERDFWLVSDEIYRRLVYAGARATSPCELGAAERTIVIDGASKTFAMTGYRIGYAAAPAEVAGAIVRLNSQMTGAPNAVSQAAFEAVLGEEPPEVAHMVSAFDERRRFLLAGLERLGLPTPEPLGAFYAFPDVGAHLAGRSSVQFCEELLEREELVLVPGEAFGAPTHVRLSYALPLERLERALERLGRFLGERAEG